jgi:hypothetical protein
MPNKSINNIKGILCYFVATKYSFFFAYDNIRDINNIMIKLLAEHDSLQRINVLKYLHNISFFLDQWLLIIIWVLIASSDPVKTTNLVSMLPPQP